MVITDKRLNMKYRFKDLVLGDVFEHLGVYYMKIGLTDVMPNAVSLKNGTQDIMGFNDEVEYVNAELVITESEGFND